MWWPCFYLLLVGSVLSENVEFEPETIAKRTFSVENVGLDLENSTKQSENVNLELEKSTEQTVSAENIVFEFGNNPRKLGLLDSGDSIVKIEKVCSRLRLSF